MRTWIVVTAILVLLVAFSAGATPWRDAIAGAFRPPDFAQDIAAARVLTNGADPYAVNFSMLHAQVLGIPSSEGYPYLPHPPFALLVTWPFGHLTFSAAALCWFATSLALSFVLAIMLSGLATAAGDFRLPASSTAIVGLGALLLWPPVLYNFEKGQFSILLAVLISGAWVALSRRDSRGPGIWLGLAAALKLFPALLGGYLLFRRRRAALWSIIAGIAATTVPLLWIGRQGIPEFVAQSQANLAHWQTWPAVTYSLRGLAARTLVGSDWSVALTRAPRTATVIVTLASAVLVVIAVHTTMRYRNRADADGLLFAVWSVLLLPLNPLAMGHNGVLLALPIVLIGRALYADSRTCLKVTWSAGCVLVSIPRQTIFAAAAVPVTPLNSFAIVAMPLWGTLLLFATAIALANRGTTTERPAIA